MPILFSSKLRKPDDGQVSGGNAWGTPPTSPLRSVAALVISLGIATGAAGAEGCAGASDDGLPGLGLGMRLDALYQEPGECDAPTDESLSDYAGACARAMELPEIPGFDCDDPARSVEVPDTGSYGTPGGEVCDRPNVLNGECDRGSRFQVVVNKETANKRGRVQIVAHCRKRGAGPGRFVDIAMIAYNSDTGDTCFFQNQLSEMDGKMPRPAVNTGNDWKTPQETEQISCIGCHDTGPFVRTPYLSQLQGTPNSEAGLPPVLPGISDDPDVDRAQREARAKGAIVPGSRDPGWNRTLPYRFVGKTFQGWRAYSVSLVEGGSSNACTGCHRMGLAAVEVNGVRAWDYNRSHGTTRGTTMTLGAKAVDPTQAHKNPHSGPSPIWMTPNSITYDQANKDAQMKLRECGNAIRRNNVKIGCNAVQFGQGTSCRGGAIVGSVNGGTVNTPTTNPQHDVVEIPIGPEIGFMGWRMLRGPFVQASQRTRFGDPSFDGTFAKISVGSSGGYRLDSGWEGPVSPTPRPGAGGDFVVTRFSEIAAVPDTTQCAYMSFEMGDFSALHNKQETTMNFDDSGVDILWASIGNVSRGSDDLFGLYTSLLGTRLRREVYKPAAYDSAVSSFMCKSWTPVYTVRHVLSRGDVLLASAAQSDRVRCFLTGLSGAWHMTRDDGKIQPYAKIYLSPTKEIRLHVEPSEGEDAVGATASCIELHP